MQNFKIFVLFVIIGGIIDSTIFIFLPKLPIFYTPKERDYSFYNINLTNIFFNEEIKKEKKQIFTLKNIKLKATYTNGKDGFIIIEEKGKTHFIDLNKKYQGYKLVKIYPDSAIFTKNHKEYKISFKKEKFESNFYEKTQTPPVIPIKKEVFNSFKQNLIKVWSNIGIIKTKEGYKITYIKPKSIFEKIGLKRGDILLEVNGRKLKNDQDAWDLYKNADKFKEFEIKIKRKNQIKVLYYEVD